MGAEKILPGPPGMSSQAESRNLNTCTIGRLLPGLLIAEREVDETVGLNRIPSADLASGPVDLDIGLGVLAESEVEGFLVYGKIPRRARGGA